MTIRSDLLTAITTALTGSSVSVSTELPWVTGGVALYNKNMKKIYVDQEQVDIEVLHRTLDRNDISQRETLVSAFLTVDAKNQPSDINTVIENVIATKESIANCFVQECDVETSIEEDRITYEFVFRFISVN